MFRTEASSLGRGPGRARSKLPRPPYATLPGLPHGSTLAVSNAEVPTHWTIPAADRLRISGQNLLEPLDLVVLNGFGFDRQPHCVGVFAVRMGGPSKAGEVPSAVRSPAATFIDFASTSEAAPRCRNAEVSYLWGARKHLPCVWGRGRVPNRKWRRHYSRHLRVPPTHTSSFWQAARNQACRLYSWAAHSLHGQRKG